jgi:NDP-sugar pyrophosphorylase family protein
VRHFEFIRSVILNGELGTRISEETHLKPKPVIKIGGKVILKFYSSRGITVLLFASDVVTA